MRNTHPKEQLFCVDVLRVFITYLKEDIYGAEEKQCI